MDDFRKNNTQLQILTDSGWEVFSGVVSRERALQTVIVKTMSKTITCTPDHKVFLRNLKTKEARQLKPGDVVLTKRGIDKVVSITTSTKKQTFDIVNAGQNSRYYANGLLVSNCEFIIYDETLVNPIMLTEMSGIDPVQKQGQVRWYSIPKKGNTYLVALDPSLGTGGDYAAIQVLELPSMKQVAEWQHNKTPIQQQVKILNEITRYLVDDVGCADTDVYYSTENNTIGEAILVTIAEYGEENIKGIFLSEPVKQGTGRRYRKGFNTTNRNKLAACAKFKSLVENKKLHLASKPIISELKNFVANGSSYAAKAGEHDDLIMSMLLAVRMAVLLREFDPNLDDKLKDGSDEILMPMPFIMV